MNNCFTTWVAMAALAASTASCAASLPTRPFKHVLLISIDGMHSVDLARIVSHHPDSVLAGLAKEGIIYAQARTPAPADSFPGMLALATGGTPAITGVYYDDSYDRDLSPSGSDCRIRGTAVVYDEDIDGPKAKQGVPDIDPSKLPRNPDGCTPVYPHQYLRVNTIFEVVRAAGGHTAWTDKHPAYEIINGPSGKGVEDLYTPEIGADAEATGTIRDKGITSSIARTEHYDEHKTNAVLAEIDGFLHDGKTPAPVPTLFGLNIQEVNVAEKVAGYTDAKGDPTPALAAAFANTDRLIGRIVAELKKKGLSDSTLLIISAKHGNAPIDPKKLRHVDEQALVRTVEAAEPGDLVHLTPDQGALIWLRAPRHTSSKVATALERSASQLGIARVLYGQALAHYFHTCLDDPRTPSLVVIPQPGVIYVNKGNKKKAEHGGYADDDRHVALLVANPKLQHKDSVVTTHLSTTRVAPTILAALGISPKKLTAVDRLGTRVLPDIWQ